MEYNSEEHKDMIISRLKDHFRPEFINRVDDIVAFRRLDKSDILKIVERQIGLLNARVADRNIRIEISREAQDLLAEEGYSPQFGARPLKREIQKRILDPLALRLLRHEFPEGSTVFCSLKDGEIVFKTKKA
jgi:ATP-dependent Clp protease ATP-binding subunit ClpB